MDAIDLVDSITVVDLVTLEAQAQNCTACPLCTTRKKVVFGEGNPTPTVFILGEGPGADEDASGRPFVGKAGQLLDKILAAAGMPRESVYIGNMVKCRPPGNRDPELSEMAACSQWLTPQLERLRPHIILTLGNIPSKNWLGLKLGITRTRGTWHRKTMPWGEILCMPIFHPSYLLRNDTRAVGGPKSQTWRDIQEVKAVVDGKEPEGLEAQILEPKTSTLKAKLEPDSKTEVSPIVPNEIQRLF